jgi:hypothetical protein
MPARPRPREISVCSIADISAFRSKFPIKIFIVVIESEKLRWTLAEPASSSAKIFPLILRNRPRQRVPPPSIPIVYGSFGVTVIQLRNNC